MRGYRGELIVGYFVINMKQMSNWRLAIFGLSKLS